MGRCTRSTTKNRGLNCQHRQGALQSGVRTHYSLLGRSSRGPKGRLRLSYFGLAIPHTAVRDIATPAAPPRYAASLRVTTDDEILMPTFASVRNDKGPTGFLDAIVAALSGEGGDSTG